MYGPQYRGVFRDDVIWGRGCASCRGKGYHVSNYRDEVRDEDTYYTCGDCLTKEQREEFRKSFGDRRLTPREKWLAGVA